VDALKEITKMEASRESSIRGISWKTPASSVPPSLADKSLSDLFIEFFAAVKATVIRVC